MAKKFETTGEFVKEKTEYIILQQKYLKEVKGYSDTGDVLMVKTISELGIFYITKIV
jgi:hypothetical protein